MDTPRPSQDTDYLRLLSIFHYVVGALGLVFSVVPAIWIAFGTSLLSGAIDRDPSDHTAEIVGWIVTVLGALFLLCALVWSVCLVLAGRYLARRSHWLFCLVVAAFSCLFTPFGTVLGVFTIIVLSRKSVREIQVAGQRLYVPADAHFSLEHESDGETEELEFQVRWPRG
jgi:hypothetical protein